MSQYWQNVPWTVFGLFGSETPIAVQLISLLCITMCLATCLPTLVFVNADIVLWVYRQTLGRVFSSSGSAGQNSKVDSDTKPSAKRTNPNHAN